MKGALKKKRIAWLRMGLVLPALFALIYAMKPAILAGDGPEYFLMLEAWAHHASPNLLPEDARATKPLLAKNAGFELVNPEAGFMLSMDGKWFSYHFWMYPLFAAPFRSLLAQMGWNEFETFRALNLTLFALAVALALRYFPGSPFKRWTFLALATMSPVLWYIAWPHSEVFSWSFVTMSVVAFARKRTALAAAAAAIAATQNSPLVFLAFAYALEPLARREWKRVLTTIAGAMIAAISPVFYYLHYRHPSPFIAVGQASPKYASIARVVGMVVDLNEGMMPYVPGLVVLGVVGVVVAVKRRAWPGMIAAPLLLAMMYASTESVNWNHGCCGMLRYAVWMLPIFAWLVATYVPRSIRAKLCVIAAVLAQMYIVHGRPGFDDSLEYTKLARYVLENAPSLYNPDPEIFVERTLMRSTRGSMDPLPVPVAFERAGVATKVLTDKAHLDVLKLEYQIDPAYLTSMRKKAPDRGLFYLNVPDGAMVRLAEHDEGIPLSHGASLGTGWSPAIKIGGTRPALPMEGAADLRLRAVDADMILAIVGTVPNGLLAPVYSLSLDDGSEVDRFIPETRDFDRTVTIARTKESLAPNGALIVTIHGTAPDGDSHATMLLRAVSWTPSIPEDTGAKEMTFASGWYAPEPDPSQRWMGKRAELVLAPHAKPMKLRMRGWPPERDLTGAPWFRISVDDHEIAYFVAFSLMEHEYTLEPNNAPTHVIFETSATGTPPGDARALGYFFDVLTWTAAAD